MVHPDHFGNACSGCAYARSNPGTAHIRCTFDWIGTKTQPPKGDPGGFRNGWWNFPLVYDPTWMISLCPSVSKERVPSKVKEQYDPLIELMVALR